MQSSNQILLSIFVGKWKRGAGGASVDWKGCWGPSLQNCLSIGAASVSSPSHQTGALTKRRRRMGKGQQGETNAMDV